MHAMSPKFFIPRYDMVSFSNIPYADALQKSHKQDALRSRLAVFFLCCISLGLWTVLLPDHKNSFNVAMFIFLGMCISFIWLGKRSK